jgi:translation initiation factor 2 subunit 2
MQLKSSPSDASILKKKKKKKSSKPKENSKHFKAKLAEAGVAEEDGKESHEEVPKGDFGPGAGIWAHSATQIITSLSFRKTIPT